MKKQLLYLLALGLSGILFFESCERKTDPNPMPVTNNNNTNNNNNNNNNISGISKTNLNNLFNPLRSTPQSFTVTAGSSQTVTGTQGTVLKFYPNSFKNAQGAIINSGTVTIKLVEMYKPGDMIANRASTVANGKPLISGGQVNIKATINGQEVYANKYSISFAETAPSIQPMALYYGNTNNADSITSWSIADTTGNGTTTNGTIADTSTNDYFHVFDSCTSFNWINCDYFYNDPSPLTNIFVVMPDTTFIPSNTQVFLVFPTINSATYLGQYDLGTSTFSLYTSYFIPIGMTIHIVAIAEKNGQFYYFQQTGLTTTLNMSVNAVMTPQTQSYILTQLSLL
jgi:hypothetical protein